MAILPQLLTCVFQFIKTNSLVFHHFRTPKKQQFHAKQHRRSMKDNYLYIYIAIGHVMLCFAENSFYDQANTNR